MNDDRATGRRRLAADIMLLVVTLVWGSTFVVVKNALDDIRPFAYLAVRFALACLLLLPFYGRAIVSGGRVRLRQGALIGLFLFLGYAFQTTGLQWTTAGKAGFITGMSVVLVPVLSVALLRQAPRRDSVAGVGLAVVGLAVLTLKDSVVPDRGDLFILACALCFAMHIISVGKYSGRTGEDAGALATIQIGAASLLAAAASGFFERNYWQSIGGIGGIPAAAWPAIAGTAVFATAGAFLIQNLAQRHTTPTHTALIFSMEPVFAAIFAYLLAAESLGVRGVAGGLMMLAGMLVAEIEPLRRAVLRRGQKKAAAITLTDA
jgi:drug/metabolite transporter (DMT)-like permease